MPPTQKSPARTDAPLVVVLDDGYGDTLIEAEILRPIAARIALRACHGRADAVRQAVHDADAVLVRESPIDAQAVAAMPRCKAVVRYGVGTDNVDLTACLQAGIAVANVPDYGVAEVLRILTGQPPHHPVAATNLVTADRPMTARQHAKAPDAT